MSLKDEIENNIVWWSCGIMVAAFWAGIGAYKGILEIANLTTLPKDSFTPNKDIDEKYIPKETVAKDYIPKTQAITTTSNFGVCEKAAIGKPYILEAVTVLGNIEVDNPRKPRQLYMDMRIVYTIRALRNITKREPVFVEQYTYRYAKGFEAWFGSEKMIHTDGNNYQIVLDMSAGDRRTITTGARFFYDWPLKERKFFNDLLTFSENEYALMYPNKDGDAICELNIIATSSTLDLKPADESAITINNLSQVTSSFRPNQTPPSEAVNTFQRSVSARWIDAVDKSTMFIKFKLKPEVPMKNLSVRR